MVCFIFFCCWGLGCLGKVMLVNVGWIGIGLLVLVGGLHGIDR